MIVDVLFTIGIMLVAFLGQTVVLPALGVTAVAPNLMLAALVPVAMLCGPYVGLAVGALAGCAVDLFFSPGIGVVALPLAALGFAAGSKNSRFRPENVMAPVIVALLGKIGVDLFALILLYFTRNPASLGGTALAHGCGSALLTAGAALPLYLLCYRVYTRGNRRRDDGQMMMAG